MKANRNPMRSIPSSVSMLIVILSLMLLQVRPQPVLAQSGDGLRRDVNAESGRVSHISPLTGRSLPASRALGTSIRLQDPAMALARRYAPEFGIKDPERELAEMKSDQDGTGHLVVRYQQNYQNVPVMGGELIVNTNEQGDLYSMSGEVSPDLSLSTRPGIDAAQAKETALQSVAKWYGKPKEDLTSTEPALWIHDESLLQPSTRPVELVWRMEVTSSRDDMPVRELVLVNAQRGASACISTRSILLGEHTPRRGRLHRMSLRRQLPSPQRHHCLPATPL